MAPPKSGFYARTICELDKKLQAKKQQLGQLNQLNAALKRRERVLKQTIYQIGAGIDAVKDLSSNSPTSGDETSLTESLCSSIASAPPADDESTYGYVSASLELALFSALEEQQEEQLTPQAKACCSAPGDAGCNCSLRRQLADIEVEVQEALLILGCNLERDQLYTTRCLRHLSPTRVQQLAERPLQQWLQEATQAVEAFSHFLPRYDGNIDGARQQLDQLVDAQVEAVLACGFAGKPRQLLQLLGVNMEGGAQQRCSPPPARWYNVAMALGLSQEQQALLKAGWGKTSADRAALLEQHSKLAERLLELQQAADEQQRRFGTDMLQVFQRLYYGARDAHYQRQQLQAALGGMLRGSAVAATAGLLGCGRGSNGSSSGSMIWQLRQLQQVLLSSCSLPGSCSSTWLVSPGSPAASPVAAGACMSKQRLRAGSPCSSSSSGCTSWADSPPACCLAADPDLLLQVSSQEQQEVEEQMGSLLKSLALLYFVQMLQMFNVLSRKQLAVAAVASWPWQCDPMAVCEALGDMDWKA